MGTLSRAEAPTRGVTWRLAAAVLLGAAAALSGFVFGLPGKGEFVALTWLAGFAALLITPGWPGFVAVITGAAVTSALLDVADGVFGLIFLIVAIVVALASHGALSAAVLQRVRTLGMRASLRDARVLGGGGVALGVVLFFVWFAGELARNPA